MVASPAVLVPAKLKVPDALLVMLAWSAVLLPLNSRMLLLVMVAWSAVLLSRNWNAKAALLVRVALPALLLLKKSTRSKVMTTLPPVVTIPAPVKDILSLAGLKGGEGLIR